MGNIPIKRARYGPPAKSGKAKPPWSGYMTRQRRAMAGFGGAVVSLGERLGSILTNQLIQSEFSEGKAALQRRDNEFFENAVDDPEYEKLSEKYSKESKKWQEEIVSRYKTPGARNALKNMITDDAPRMDKTLNGIIKRKAQDDARRKTSDSIESFIPSAGAIPDELELGIINATAAMQRAVNSGLYSKDEGEEIIIYALMTDWPEVALKEIDASSLTSKRKIQLRSQVNAVIRNTEIEQSKVEREVWDKTEGEAFNLWFDNKLTPEWVRDQFNEGNLSPQDRDEYLSMLSRTKQVHLDYDVYDRLQTMIEGYDAEKYSKEEVRLAINKEAGKTIPKTIAMKLRDRLAIKDDPDDPMNRSDVKRGLGVLTDLESFEVEQAKRDKEDIGVIREIRLSYQKKMDEFERWIRGREKLTDKDVQTKIGEMTELEAEEQVKGWLDFILNPLNWESGTAGTKIRGLLRREPKKGEEDLIGMTIEELEAIINK